MKLKILSLVNNWIHILTVFLAIFLPIVNFWFILFSLIYFFKYFVYQKYLLILILIFALILIKLKLNERDFNSCIVIESSLKNSICKGKNKVLVYQQLKVGNVYKINTKRLPKSDSGIYLFDYRLYLKSKNIKYIAYDGDLTYLESKFTPYLIKEKVEKYLNNFTEPSKSYLYALIIGDKSYLEEENLTKIKDLGIIHLFAISGLHVGLLYLILNYFLNIFLKEKAKDNSIIVFFSIYLIITGFSVSVLRTVLMVVLKIFFKRLKIPFSSLDCLIMAFFIMITFNLYSIFDSGFQLSYIVTFSLLLSRDIVKGNYWKQSFSLSLLAQLVTLPIIINLNNQFNLITIFANIIFVFFVSYILLPITFINFLLKVTEIYNYIIFIFENLLNVFSKFSYSLNVGNLHPLLIVIYYLLLYQHFVKVEKNKRSNFYFYLILICLISKINFVDQVYYLNVGQGDSTLIKQKFGSCNTLIDTGGMFRREIVDTNVLPVLQAVNIFELDYLVLTHSHFDHVGGAKNIIDDLKVKNLVISEYNNGKLINEIVDYAEIKKVNVIKVKKGDRYGCFNEFTVIDPNQFSKKINNQSIVQVLTLNGLKFLFLADVEKTDYQMNIDVLKAGHHGSNTSYSQEMHEKLTPDIAIISVGENNYYNHPSIEVLNILQDTDYYRTDKDGTIIYFGILKGIFINTNTYNKYILGKILGFNINS